MNTSHETSSPYIVTLTGGDRETQTETFYAHDASEALDLATEHWELGGEDGYELTIIDQQIADALENPEQDHRIQRR